MQENQERSHGGVAALLPPLYGQNTLKILLGVALVHRDRVIFQLAVEQLGEQIQPFSSDFNQAAEADFNGKVRDLLELTLKACLIAADDMKTCGRELILDTVKVLLNFSLKYNYLLSVDEQTVRFMVE